jgi:hypothetical protein
MKKKNIKIKSLLLALELSFGVRKQEAREYKKDNTYYEKP